MARIAFDIDGVVAEYEELEKFDPEEFNDIFMKANPIKGCREALEKLCLTHKVYLVTGRYPSHWENTEEWLKRHGIPYHEAVINHYCDYTINPEYKAETSIKHGIIMFFDDRKDVVDHINTHTKCRAHIFKGWNEVVKQVVDEA